MDIATVAEIGTAAGTLFLGLATFAAVRSGNRSARIAERALLLGLRPALTQARPEDADQKVQFGDGRRFKVAGGRALVDEDDGVVYLAIPLRNVGAGLAVLQRYDIRTDLPMRETHRPLQHGAHDRESRSYRSPEHFRDQQRDIYVAAGDTGYWQAALRDPSDPLREEVSAALAAGDVPISVDILYGDHDGAQHLISRFTLIPVEGVYVASVVFHWFLDADDPRG
jgi:hypothetical protein